MRQHKNDHPFSFMFRLFQLVFMSYFVLTAGMGEADTNGQERFKQGRKCLKAEHYREAVENFSVSRQEFQLLEDYSLFYLSQAFRGL